jgi:thiosulfate dehydrogenase [quinone] large subunit
MEKSQRISLFLLRLALGWLFFYAGITKLLAPAWSAEGYLKGAKLFTGFYQWLSSPAMLPITNFINAWGLTILGISLILGIGVRLFSILGAILMILYYIPLGFPMPDAHSYIVDDHIVYALALIFMSRIRAGRVIGLDNWLIAKFPKLGSKIG